MSYVEWIKNCHPHIRLFLLFIFAFANKNKKKRKNNMKISYGYPNFGTRAGSTDDGMRLIRLDHPQLVNSINEAVTLILWNIIRPLNC